MDHAKTIPMLVVCFSLLTLSASSCNLASNGRGALERSQQAAMRMDHFNVELLRSTKIGNFKALQSIDCSARYFYEHEFTDLTPLGIESGITLSQGRPSAHHESEHLFVNGRTYGRNTSSWENAPFGYDDSRSDWGPFSTSRDPSEECASMKRGAGFGYVGSTRFSNPSKMHNRYFICFSVQW